MKKKSMKKSALVPSLLLLAGLCTALAGGPAGCGGRGGAGLGRERPGGSGRGDQKAAASKTPGAKLPTVARHRKLIRTVDLDIAVMDTRSTAEQVEEMVAACGGYVSDTVMRQYRKMHCYEMVLRIPQNRLGDTVKAVKDLAKRVRQESLATQDVTEQYVDSEARLKTLQALEQELAKLLAESRKLGRTMEEILRIYRELTDIRSQIEQLQGRLTVLDRQVGFSTVRLGIFPDDAAVPMAAEGWQPGETVRMSGRALLAILRGLANAIIFVVIVIVPVLLLFVAPLYLGVKLKRKVREGKQLPMPPGPPPQEQVPAGKS